MFRLLLLPYKIKFKARHAAVVDVMGLECIPTGRVALFPSLFRLAESAEMKHIQYHGR